MTPSNNLKMVKRSIKGFHHLTYFYRNNDGLFSYETETDKPLDRISYMIRDDIDQVIFFETMLNDHIYSYLEELLNDGKQ